MISRIVEKLKEQVGFDYFGRLYVTKRRKLFNSKYAVNKLLNWTTVHPRKIGHVQKTGNSFGLRILSFSKTTNDTGLFFGFYCNFVTRHIFLCLPCPSG